MKVAIVTGASSGIGLGITRALLARDYNVIATARRASKAGTLEPSARLDIVDGDIADARTAERVTGVARELGRLDLLVNNAGIFIAKPFVDYDADDYARLVGTNLAGFFHMTQAALRTMKGPGHIVSISTSLTTQPIQGLPSALPVLTKGGIDAATRSLSLELVDRNIRVNAIAVGIVATPMHAPGSEDVLRTMNPQKRIGSVSDIADAVLYLESASFVTGEILHVDGGSNAGRWS